MWNHVSFQIQLQSKSPTQGGRPCYKFNKVCFFCKAQNKNQQTLTKLFSGEATSLLTSGISYFLPLTWPTFHFSSNFNILNYICLIFFLPGTFRSWKEASWYQKEYSRCIRYQAKTHFSEGPKSIKS